MLDTGKVRYGEGRGVMEGLRPRGGLVMWAWREERTRERRGRQRGRDERRRDRARTRVSMV